MARKSLTPLQIAQIQNTSGQPVLQTLTGSDGSTLVGVYGGTTGLPAVLYGYGNDTNINIGLRGKGTGVPQILGSSDVSKILEFNANGASTSTKTTVNSSQTGNRTITLPDATDTLVGKATTDNLSNKNLSSSSNVFPAGHLIQRVNTQTGTMATGSTLVPVDNSIPQNNEGDQYMSLAITPKATSNILYIEIVAHFYFPSGSANIVAALFQDSTANAVASILFATGGTGSLPIVFRHKMTAGTTSATTFKLRAGPQIAGTLTFNGLAGSSYMGGTIASSITIDEVQA